MKRMELFKSNRGSILVQVLIASVIALVVVLTLAQLTVMMNRYVSHAQTKLTLFELRNNLLSTILSEAAWVNTVAHDDNEVDPQKHICLSGTNGDVGPAIDCSNISEPLTLVDGSDNVITSRVAVNDGFTRKGEVCDSFNSGVGDPTCPIRAEARWETDCVSPCNMRAPPLKITVSFLYVDPALVSSINTEQLKFVIRR